MQRYRAHSEPLKTESAYEAFWSMSVTSALNAPADMKDTNIHRDRCTLADQAALPHHSVVDVCQLHVMQFLYCMVCNVLQVASCTTPTMADQLTVYLVAQSVELETHTHTHTHTQTHTNTHTHTHTHTNMHTHTHTHQLIQTTNISGISEINETFWSYLSNKL